jgi:predicted RNase H-like nuclease (RuvC/YqgF family)
MTLDAAGWLELEEGLQGLYEDREGVYTLAVEGLIKEDVGGLKSALEKERAAAKEAEKKVKAWEALGKKPEEIAELLKKPDPKAHEAYRAELEGLRKEFATLQEERKAERRAAEIARLLADYDEDPEKRELLAGMVKGATSEEIGAEVEKIRKLFPPSVKKIGGPGGSAEPRRFALSPDSEAVKYAKELGEKHKRRNINGQLGS